MPEPISFKDQATSAFIKGSIIMGIQTTGMHPLNRMSVVQSQTGKSISQVAKAIFSGKIDDPINPKKSFVNLYKGISGHVLKETVRLTFKPFGVVFLIPELNRIFPSSPLKASLSFAAVMSIFEIIINPADTIRVRLQSGQPLKSLWPNPVKQLYAGSLANGARQFGTWGVVNFSGTHLDRIFSEHTKLNTRTIDGMVPKSCIQAVLLTTVAYPPFERIKNELQIHASLSKGTTSPYKAAINNIFKRRGIVSFMDGFTPKILSNCIMVYGFNWLLENGKPKPLTEISTTKMD